MLIFFYIDLEEYLHEKKKFWEQCSKDLEDKYTNAEQAENALALRQSAVELEILRYKEVWNSSLYNLI